MPLPVLQSSLSAGEIAPSLFAMVDLAKWHQGAALLRNFFVDYRGGASNRTGTQFIVPCLSGTNRLIPFTYSVTQTYGLLFSDLKLRFITNGGALLETAKTVTGGITSANPCVVTAAGHGFSNGDWVWITGVGGMPRINNRFYVVQNVTANTFSLQDWNGVNIDSTSYGAYTSGGTAGRVYTIASPYAQADLALLKYTQSADVMTFTHPSYQPRQLIRSSATSWAFSTISAGPAPGFPTITGVTAKLGAGTTTYSYIVTAVNNKGQETSGSTPDAISTAQIMSTTAGEFITVTWIAPGAGFVPVYYNVYRQIEIPNGAPDSAQLYGFVGSCTGLSFVDHNVSPDFTRTIPIGYDPFASSAYPACVTYDKGRQVFAGASAAPETLNYSKPGDFTNFGYSTPSRPNDGIVATLASRQVNAVKHLISMNSLIAMTGGGAWKIDGGSPGAAVTPSTIQASAQAFNGCSDVPPLPINYDILYVQAKGAIVRDLAYNFYVNLYTGSDITTLSNHLFFGRQITEWAWAEEPFKIVWAVRDDGVMLSLTFVKEQEMIGWAHHDTQGLFKSVCSISEGTEDVVYLVVERLINGNLVQYVERMASRKMGSKPDYDPPIPADLTKAWFVDCGLRTTLLDGTVLTKHHNGTLTPSSTGAAPSNIPVSIVYSIVGADLINGGSGYTNPAITVSDYYGTGSGAQITATVVGGVITAVTVASAGQNYQLPIVTITDATGTGAVIQAIPSNDVVMTCSDTVTANVGDMLRMNDGWGTVRVVTDSTHFTVNVLQPFSSVWPAAAANWTCTTPVTSVVGLDHVEGCAAAVLADGNVVSDGINNPLTVTNGTITLPQAASDILIGLNVTARFKSLYADIPGQQPTVQGRRITIPACTIRVCDTRGLMVGHDFVDMVEFKERNQQPMGSPILPFTGDQRFNLGSDWQVDAQLCAQQINPLPATILGLIPELSVGDTPG